MKKYLVSLLALFAGFSLIAQEATSAVTGGTALNLLDSGGKIIDSIIFTSTTTNNTTVKFYDSSTSTTNIVRAAYTSYASYATNFDSVWTNESGLLVTNTFSGRWTYPTSVSAVTNERPKILTMVVVAGSQRTKLMVTPIARGLTLLSDYNGVVEVNYRNQ